MPRLVIKKPLGPVVDLPLVEGVYSLGRAADNKVVLEGSLISRHHGELRREGDGFFIADLGSHNGIFLNGQKVERAPLKDRDEIRIGNYVLLFYEGDVPETGPAPMVETVTVEEDYDKMVGSLTTVLRPAPQKPDTSLLQRMEKERRTLGLLCDLSRALSTLYSLEDVSQKALQILLETTQAERGAMFLLQDDGKTLRPTTVCERKGGPATSGSVAISSTVADRILAERKGIITADAGEDPRFAHGQSVVLRGLRSIACAPLVGASGNLGILYLENNRSIGAFSHDDLELLCAVASQVGLSVENAKFFEALRRSNEELELKVEQRTAELRESQMKLYQAEKIKSLSRLVAGVAHEVNNPLGALKANLEVVMVMAGRLATGEGRSDKEVKMVEQLVRISQQSVNACTRIVGVMRSLRSFARLDESEFKMANLNEGLTAIVQLLDPAVRKRIEVITNLGELPPIPCYPALLNEAFMNILSNSCQAITQTGQIFIESRKEDEEIVVSFRDTGCGIAKEHLPKIFEPGFTTKSRGVGVGLGLPIAFSVIKEHNGSIHVESDLGKGATFTIRLPVALEKSPAS
ncbi:MAG: FHA domain-containing protein [Acidobacteria bacterium]|nr:FHA domain-containing protein [Acidobacteriota bacterium]